MNSSGLAPARAALAGNPSDLYGGAVLAVTVQTWSAEASVRPAEALRVEPPSPLVEATARRFGRQVHPAAFRVATRWRSSIPQAVGLGGSSAIVIATTRALSAHCGIDQTPAELAEFALAVETKELGIVAGPQDRVAQAHGGLTFMDFSGRDPACETLNPCLLPPLLIAWRAEAGSASGLVHARAARRTRDEAVVRDLADAARAARTALLASDHAAFAAAVDRTVDLRGRLLELDAPSLEMVHVVRRCGAAANYTGSGGAIVAVAASIEQLDRAAAELRALGCGVLADPR